jgi:hypothetical protein
MLMVRSKPKNEREYLLMIGYPLLGREFFSHVIANVISERKEKRV